MGLPLTGFLPPLGAVLAPPGPRCGVFPLSTVASSLGHMTHPVYHPHLSQQPFGNATAGVLGRVGRLRRQALRTWGDAQEKGCSNLP